MLLCYNSIDIILLPYILCAILYHIVYYISLNDFNSSLK